MTDRIDPDDVQALIDEARGAVLTMDYERAYQGGLIGRLADALEAAEKELAMRRSESADFERERDELAAVIERAREAGRNGQPAIYRVIRILSAAPADVLREHDRQVAERAWDEGFTRGFYAGQAYPDGTDASEPDIDNPYRKEQENGDPR